MADVSTATSYMISDLPVKQVPSGTDIFLLEDAEGNAYQVPASALALSSEQVTAAINAWLAAHPEATTTVVDGSITMQKLAIDVTGAFQSLSDDIDGLETSLGNKVPYPQTGGANDYGTAGQALLSKGDGTTEWGAGGGGSGILWSRQDINLFQTVLQKIKYSSADAGTIVTQLINSLNAKPTDEGWTMAQIDLLDSLLDYVEYTEADGGEYADQLIDSLKGLIPTYEDVDSEEY